jgi:hypothetical protein
MEPLLTIGMATFDDFDGVYFTIQSLRMHHRDIMDKCEIVVIDNNPNGKHGPSVSSLIGHLNSSQPRFPARYIPFFESVGTSSSRDRIFKEAKGKFVLCTDCHVLFWQDALERFINYIESNPNESAIMHGPLMYDDLKNISTHFNDQWRSEMWGTWGSAWVDKYNNHFTCIEKNRKVHTVQLIDGKTPVTIEGVSDLDWAGHERQLTGLGCKPLGREVNEHPFDIPGQGLGVFACAKAYWPGFNPDARGFGGEELYVHKKHRSRGHRVILLPFLRWLHRFSRPEGVKYPLTLWNKVRNYVLEFQEMDWNLEEVYNHFVEENKRITPAEWFYLVADAKHRIVQPDNSYFLTQYDSMDKIFDKVKTEFPNAITQMETLKKYADKSDSALDLSVNIHAAVALMNSSCERIDSFNGNPTNINLHEAIKLDSIKKKKLSLSGLEYSNFDVFSPSDLISIDTTPEGSSLTTILNTLIERGLVRRFIVVNGTKTFGEFSPTKQYGLMVAIRAFLHEHPEFTVIEHNTGGDGVTVLSMDDRDKTSLPSFGAMAKNLFGSAISYVAEGGAKVSKENYEGRLAACTVCPHRNNKQCGLCGCYIEVKGQLAGQAGICPIGKWAEVDRSLKVTS